MKPALFNTVEFTPAQRELADRVYVWLLISAMKSMSHIGAKYDMTAPAIRPVIELLLSQGRIGSQISGKKRVYGIRMEQVPQIEAARTWKPLKENPQLSERYAEIKALRAAHPSKHI